MTFSLTDDQPSLEYQPHLTLWALTFACRFLRLSNLLLLLFYLSGRTIINMTASRPPVTLDLPCFLNACQTTFRRNDVRRIFIDAFWPLYQGSTDDLDNFRAYFAFVEWECENSIPSAHAATTLADLLEILNVVKANPAVRMSELRQKVRDSNPSFGKVTNDVKISASIELVVRLCFMINVRNIMPAESFTLRTALPWPDSASLQDIIQNWQKQVCPAQQPTRLNFPSIPELEKIAGFTIRWTNDLANHLEVDNRTLYVFHHVTVLRRIRESNLG